MIRRILALLAGLALFSCSARAAEPTRGEAAAALKKAVTFFRDKVSIEGGYLWRYSEDLSLREGENAATATQAWVQPPGTPSVGEALLAAHERTQEKYLLDAGVQTARALVKCQLSSGGWDYRLEFDPAKRSTYAYRTERNPGERARNVTTLDDNTTQAAVRFLMHVDRALDFKDQAIHEATEFALESLVKAQYPNGAWPQRYSAPPKAEDFPVVKANYPESWSRTWPNVNYMSFYTLNDNTQADVIDVMFEAAEIYKQTMYSDAGKRGGDFLILAQMPEPQPAWAQQYNVQMQPAWARKFEPASVTGGESQGAIRILMDVYRQTGDKKYLAPIPRALDYLEKSVRADGRMPRFLELKTNRPLYFTRQYELVYTDNDMPTHYSFITSNNIARIRAEYERLLATPADQLKPTRRRAGREESSGSSESAGRVIAALDARGAWVEDGRLRDSDPEGKVRRVITTQTFMRNVEALSRFVGAGK